MLDIRRAATCNSQAAKEMYQHGGGNQLCARRMREQSGDEDVVIRRRVGEIRDSPCHGERNGSTDATAELGDLTYQGPEPTTPEKPMGID